MKQGSQFVFEKKKISVHKVLMLPVTSIPKARTASCHSFHKNLKEKKKKKKEKNYRVEMESFCAFALLFLSNLFSSCWPIDGQIPNYCNNFIKHCSFTILS